jgi:hypothetical protein
VSPPEELFCISITLRTLFYPPPYFSFSDFFSAKKRFSADYGRLVFYPVNTFFVVVAATVVISLLKWKKLPGF